MFDKYFNKEYWVIDILPKQVPADSEGQYFAVEKYYLEKPCRSELQRKFLDILLKLNCYYDFEVWPLDHNNCAVNPEPEILEEFMMAQKEAINIILPSANSMIVTQPDDLYMTVYNPDEKLLELIQKLASAEGLFVWKPGGQMLPEGRYIGVDGCKNGWIAVILERENLIVRKFESISELIKEYPEFDGFLIDMAIGLQESKGEKRPDADARKLLKGVASSIFPVPARQAVMAKDEERQKAENLRILDKSLSKQSIAIIPKIKELDEFLDKHRKYKNIICESHPELCFARLNGKPLQTKKYSIEGFEERKSILLDYLSDEMLDGLWEKAKELKCNTDDVIDAVCLAVVASLSVQGKCMTIPDEPDKDARGLKMQMIVPKEKNEE